MTGGGAILKSPNGNFIGHRVKVKQIHHLDDDVM